jgi:DNA-binding MarR family transcriptional regulator
VTVAQFWHPTGGVDAERGRDVMVVEAVHALSGRRAPVSVNDIAHELGVDQSGASRMVTRAERLNLLTRRAPGSVGERSSIAVAAAGEDLLRRAHVWQDTVFRSLTAGWPDEDVQSLLTLIGRLVEAQTKRDAQ